MPHNVMSPKRKETISDNGKITRVFNDFFVVALRNMDITTDADEIIICNVVDPVLREIEKYEDILVSKK